MTSVSDSWSELGSSSWLDSLVSCWVDAWASSWAEFLLALGIFVHLLNWLEAIY